MTRRCRLTGKCVRAGRNVSHAENKTPRTFRPNLGYKVLHSDLLGRGVRIRVCASTIRTIDHNGGLDQWLLGERARKLTPEARKLRLTLLRARERAQGAAQAQGS